MPTRSARRRRTSPGACGGDVRLEGWDLKPAESIQRTRPSTTDHVSTAAHSDDEHHVPGSAELWPIECLLVEKQVSMPPCEHTSTAACGHGGIVLQWHWIVVCLWRRHRDRHRPQRPEWRGPCPFMVTVASFGGEALCRPGTLGPPLRCRNLEQYV
jgi:hypothetical protein